MFPQVTAGDLERDTELEARGDGRYRAVLGRAWWVERGPNGGFLAGLALRTAKTVAAAKRDPCSLTFHYLDTAGEGPLDLTVEMLRDGRRLTNCVVRMEQEGRAVAIALVALATARSSAEPFDETRFPNPPPPDALESLPVNVPGVPPFLRNYDVRFALGHLPFSGAREAVTGVWLRTVARRRPDAIAVAAFMDGWAHAPLVRRRSPAPTPTIDLTIHFRDHAWYERASDDDFVLVTLRSRLLSNGLFEEDGEAWSPDGTLLAHSRQLGLLLD